MKIKLELQSLGDDGYHLFCTVKINGLKFRALIDTGASKTVVGQKLIKKLQLEPYQPEGNNQMTGIQPGEMNVKFAMLKTISFNSLHFENIIVGIIDLKHVNQQYKSLKIKPFQLIIGGDILVRGNAVIDYRNKILKLYKN